jgi:DNA polymerase III subunit gamma/tau
MPYEPLHHKYRPQTFAELVGQAAVATTLTNALRQQRIAPAYLFTGARGTGKTSSARILAKSLNCLSSLQPTETPCGQCEVCRMIANSSALDVIEIDAASNTGVDNIRELIERAQFAPVQCRYKVYVIDECLTGDALVLTDKGLVRIDDPMLKGQKVLSYNDKLNQWEFKSVVRWLDQGKKQILEIQTTHRRIRCTENHLIRTDRGWIAAKDIKEGTRILSPVSVDVAQPSSNLVPMVASVDLPEDTSFWETLTDKRYTAWMPFGNRLSHCAPSVLAAVVKSWISQAFYSIKGVGFRVFDRTGNAIPTGEIMGFGNAEPQTLLLEQVVYHLRPWDSYTEPCWETVPLDTPINTVASHDCPGHMEHHNRSGRSTKPSVSRYYNRSLEFPSILDMGNSQHVVAQPVIQNWLKFSGQSNLMDSKNTFLGNGLNTLLPKDWLGGTWMMALSASALKEAPKFSSIPKDTRLKKISSWLTGLLQWAIQQQRNLTPDRAITKPTTTSGWEQILPENGSPASNNTQSHQWTTNLETVESVRPAGIEQVYDIEVEDNHNFVANGLLVHNCHMLSTAAFNALLKTLEEPPDRVVFVLATTDPQRVLPTIISRCQRFDFRRIPLEAMVDHLSVIADKEAIEITPDAIQLVAQISQGGLRDAESLLDQLSLLAGQITADRVWELVGAVPERDLLALVRAIGNDEATTALEQARRLMDRGREPLIVLQNLASFYRDLLIAKTSPDRRDLVAITPPTWAEMVELAQTLPLSTILRGQQQLRESEGQVKNTTQPRLWLEVALMGLLPSASVPIDRPPVAAPSLPAPKATPPPVSASAGPQSIANNGHDRRSTAASPRIEPAPPAASPSSIAEPAPVATNETIAHSPDDSLIAPPDESIALPDESAAAIDLEQIWQDVLAQIRFRGTQVLLDQQGCLLAFDGHEARIGIKSQPLFQMAKKQLHHIETAFEAVYQHAVRISLEITAATEPTAPASQPTRESASPPPRRSIAKDPASSGRSQPSPQTTGEASPGYRSSQPPLPIRQSVPETDPALLSVNGNVNGDVNGNVNDDVKDAARSMAQFFNGEIVSLDDEFEIPIGSLVEEAVAQSTAEPEADVEDSGDPDDDVPF